MKLLKLLDKWFLFVFYWSTPVALVACLTGLAFSLFYALFDGQVDYANGVGLEITVWTAAIYGSLVLAMIARLLFLWWSREA